MTASIDILKIASNLASHAYKRQSLIAMNIANADTPGYKASDLEKFSQAVEKQGFMKATRPGHRMPPRDGVAAEANMINVTGTDSPNGNNVTLEDQMVRSADIRQQHDLALGVYQKTMAIMKASLGRR